MAKSAYKWTKVSEGGKWVHYCTSHNLPHIINLKNDKYKVEAGKDSRIEDDWESAVKYATVLTIKMPQTSCQKLKRHK